MPWWLSDPVSINLAAKCFNPNKLAGFVQKQHSVAQGCRFNSDSVISYNSMGFVVWRALFSRAHTACPPNVFFRHFPLPPWNVFNVFTTTSRHDEELKCAYHYRRLVPTMVSRMHVIHRGHLSTPLPVIASGSTPCMSEEIIKFISMGLSSLTWNNTTRLCF